MNSINSSIWINDVTSVDCAYVQDNKIYGWSYDVHVTLTGSTENSEQVVLDFSKAKSLIKYWYDNLGPDHRLCSDLPIPNSMHVPNNAVYRGGVFNKDEHALAIKSFLYLKTDQIFDIDIHTSNKNPEIRCMPKNTSSIHSFDYTHGLAKSSSFGCQNIAHGHHSVIMSPLVDEPIMTYCVNKILQNSYFVNREYVKNSYIVYESDSRGTMRLDKSMCPSNIIIMENEPTIENMANTIGELLRKSGIAEGKLYVSEGLHKGALVDLSNLPKVKVSIETNK